MTVLLVLLTKTLVTQKLLSEDDDGKQNELVELDGEGDTEGEGVGDSKGEDDIILRLFLFANEIDLLNWGIWHLFDSIWNYPVSLFLRYSH